MTAALLSIIAGGILTDLSVNPRITFGVDRVFGAAGLLFIVAGGCWLVWTIAWGLA